MTIRRNLAWMIVLGFGAAAMAAHGEAYGGIDVGSRAVKARLFVFQGNGETRNTTELYNRTVPISLATSITEGKFSDKAIKETAAAVAQVLGQMTEIARTQKLGQVQYFVLGGSGLAGVGNLDQLRAGIAEQTGGFGITFIDSRTESYHGLRSAVPEPRRGDSVVVDTGTANSTLACVINDGSFQSAELPFGTVSLRNEAIDAANYDTALKERIEKRVRPALKREILGNPCFANRQWIYWTGQAAWAVATYTHPERALNAYVAISRQDIDTLLERLRGGNWQAMPKLVLSADAEKLRAAIATQATRDWKAVQDSFVREDLMAGLSLFRAMLESANPNARVIFARSGHYLYGYALEHYVETKALTSKSASAHK